MSTERESLRSLGALEIANRIYEIGLLASQSGDLDTVIKAICTRLMEVTGADYSGIGLVDESGEWLVHRAGTFHDGTDVRRGYRHRLGEGVTGKVAAEGKPVCIQDVRSDPRYLDLISGTRSELAYPLMMGGRVLGTLNLESTQVGRFGEATMALVQALASPVSLAIRNAYLVEKEHQRFLTLQKLSRVSEVITSTVDLDTLLERAAHSIRAQFEFDLVALGLLDEQREVVVLRALNSQLPVELETGHAQPLGQGVTGHVVKTGKSLLLADAGTFPGRVATGLGLGSEICSPLRVGGRCFGFLDAESRRKNSLDESDLLLLEMVADHIAPAVQNALNLQQNLDMREQMYGMLVHDLRNPLTVIGSSVDLLERQIVRMDLGAKQGTPRPEHMDSALRKVHHARGACDQMLVMIDGMLELHRMETGALQLMRKPTDCADLVASVARSMSTVAEAERIVVEVEAEEGLGRMLLDPGLITRVLENLLVNSLKFTPPGGRLDLRVSEAPASLVQERLGVEATGVLFSLSDTGEGIPREDQERIFDRFAVLESRRQGRKHSTGLGLAFCKQAVTAHQGAIWVQSEPGQGSTFFVLLPGYGEGS